MKHNIKVIISLLMLATGYGNRLLAQDVQSYSLEQLKEAALKNNHVLAIKEWQIKEKQAKIEEDAIKKYIVPTLSSNYQYNFNLGELTIPAGTIGELPLSPTNVVLLPDIDKNFEVGEHHNYNAGLTVYQPITQLAKIRTGLEIDRTDVTLAEKEKFKIFLQIKQAIEQLYYGTLIAQKQKEEAEAKLALAQSKLTDVENALLAGKTITVDKAGLQASIADQEQTILKLNIQMQDYMGDLLNATGLTVDSLKLEAITPDIQLINALDEYRSAAASSNIDLQIANLNKSKSLLGIKAARQSSLPDVGLIAGYTYQFGNPILPANNPIVGASLKWNLQDVFSNKKVLKQRQFQLKQAEENIINTQQQVNNNIEKAYRKVNQSRELIAVAQRVAAYRKEEMKLQEDKQAAGLNVRTDLLNTRSLLAKAEADMYAAQLSYLVSVSDLRLLIGQ